MIRIKHDIRFTSQELIIVLARSLILSTGCYGPTRRHCSDVYRTDRRSVLGTCIMYRLTFQLNRIAYINVINISVRRTFIRIPWYIIVLGRARKCTGRYTRCLNSGTRRSCAGMLPSVFYPRFVFSTSVGEIKETSKNK